MAAYVKLPLVDSYSFVNLRLRPSRNGIDESSSQRGDGSDERLRTRRMAPAGMQKSNITKSAGGGKVNLPCFGTTGPGDPNRHVW